jgi:hypothetical protein
VGTKRREAALVFFLILITAGLLIASYLLRPKITKPEDEIIETSLSRRGEFISYVVGCHKIESYFFAWAGDRFSRDEGGGSGKGGGRQPGQTIWFESGWHVLCVGPAHGLKAIFQNGEVLWEGNITPSTHPSGTSITLDDGEGTFRIFWGEVNQPINEFLSASDRVNIRSRWPFATYVEWREKRLGGSAVWPKLDYIVCVECHGIALKDSPFWLDDNTSQGVNGGHALLRMLSLPFPHGAGIPTQFLDNDSLEEIGLRCEEEHLPVNTKSRGETYELLVQNLLQDIGYWITQIGPRLRFYPWRETTVPVPLLNEDVIEPPDMENVRSFPFDLPSRIVFTYKSEEELKYEDQDIKFDDDSVAEREGAYDIVNSEISSFTHAEPASAAARRRSQESSLHSAQRFTALRGARNLQPGQVFDRPGMGRMLVMGRRPKDDGPGVEIEAVFDQYAFPDIEDVVNPGPGSGGPLAVQPDIAFDWFKLPDSDSSIIVFRIRAHQQIAGSRIYVASQGSGFLFVNNQNSAAAGGLLIDDAIDAGDGGSAGIIEGGPIFETDNLDVLGVLDLSGNEPAWLAGEQFCLISDGGMLAELFYLRNVTAQSEDEWESATAYSTGDFVIPEGPPTGLRYVCVSGGTSGASEPSWPTTIGETVSDGSVTWEARGFAYRLEGLLRAQEGSAAIDHPTGRRVYIIRKNLLSILTHSIIQPGTTLCVKSVPFTNSQVVPIGSVDPVCKPITLVSPFRTTHEGFVRTTDEDDIRTLELD